MSGEDAGAGADASKQPAGTGTRRRLWLGVGYWLTLDCTALQTADAILAICTAICKVLCAVCTLDPITIFHTRKTISPCGTRRITFAL